MSATARTTEPPSDVFSAARWLDEQCNSTARPVTPQMIEWQCNTWGSGRGGGSWTDTAIFAVVAEAFGLDTGKNREGRDELIVFVPMDQYAEIAALIDRLTDDHPEMWPWLNEQTVDRQLAVAADILGKPVAELAENEWLLDALHIL